MFSLTSVELNFLVFRYLQESGLTHSAFALGYEAGLSNCPIDGNMVPPGALIKFIQKGLQYLEMEANLSNNETDLDEDFSFIEPLDLITKDVNELRQMINDRKKTRCKHAHKVISRQHEGKFGGVAEKQNQDNKKEHVNNREVRRVSDKKQGGGKVRKRSVVSDKKQGGGKVRKRSVVSVKKQGGGKVRKRSVDKITTHEHKVKQLEDHTDIEMVSAQEDKASVEDKENEFSEGPQPMDINTSTTHAHGVLGIDVMILEGHTGEVCACAWSSAGSLLASGSGDSTARIWSVADMTNKVKSPNTDVLVLEHVKGKTNDRNKDVTSLDWSSDGSLLATGCYDGQARIWTLDGKLRSTLSKHNDAIFSIKWNKKGDYILTGSLDTSAIVWDVKTNRVKQRFEFHSGAALDTDWRNNVSFATSTNTMIHVCKIGTDSPIKTFSGHQREVNSVKWDPTGSLLASCSDDTTAKIWSLRQDKYVHDFPDHTKGIYNIRWSPTGQGTSNPNKQLLLASASIDSTVKTWDVKVGKRLLDLKGHRDAVYSIAFSPDGELLASGSKDKSICIWSLKEGKIVKSFTGDGSVFEVSWNKEGNKVVGCSNRNSVFVVDMRT